MIIDFETFIGHFAFRRVPNSSAAGLLKQMDGEGIDRALVSALECVTYRNVQAGNEILAERLAGTHGRLMGAAVVNPAYPRAAEDARRCLTDLRMSALRLLPRYHGYTLGEEVQALGCRGVMTVAADLAAPVSITYEIEDDRQHHLLFKPSELAAEEIAAAILAFPDVNFVLERISPSLVRRVQRLAAGVTNWYVNISGRGMLGATVHLGIADVLDWIGPDRVLLGTGMALQYPRAPFLKLDSLSLDHDTLRKIKGENASRLLRLSAR
ncbi:MAG: amidohydrolase family protein [Planctomycetota bacterium]|jgi:predicted TIM-barrel fold metal-dependent hydrolase